MRGLKQIRRITRLTGLQVAPYVGAWIETEYRLNSDEEWKVAPYVGAWIETSAAVRGIRYAWSHPTWVRGLKHSAQSPLQTGHSRTLRGCVD